MFLIMLIIPLHHNPPLHRPPSIMKHKLSLKPLQTLSVPVFVRPSPPRSVVLHNEQ